MSYYNKENNAIISLVGSMSDINLCAIYKIGEGITFFNIGCFFYHDGRIYQYSNWRSISSIEYSYSDDLGKTWSTPIHATNITDDHLYDPLGIEGFQFRFKGTIYDIVLVTQRFTSGDKPFMAISTDGITWREILENSRWYETTHFPQFTIDGYAITYYSYDSERWFYSSNLINWQSFSNNQPWTKIRPDGYSTIDEEDDGSLVIYNKDGLLKKIRTGLDPSISNAFPGKEITSYEILDSLFDLNKDIGMITYRVEERNEGQRIISLVVKTGMEDAETYPVINVKAYTDISYVFANLGIYQGNFTAFNVFGGNSAMLKGDIQSWEIEYIDFGITGYGVNDASCVITNVDIGEKNISLLVNTSRFSEHGVNGTFELYGMRNIYDFFSSILPKMSSVDKPSFEPLLDRVAVSGGLSIGSENYIINEFQCGNDNIYLSTTDGHTFSWEPDGLSVDKVTISNLVISEINDSLETGNIYPMHPDTDNIGSDSRRYNYIYSNNTISDNISFLRLMFNVANGDEEQNIRLANNFNIELIESPASSTDGNSEERTVTFKHTYETAPYVFINHTKTDDNKDDYHYGFLKKVTTTYVNFSAYSTFDFQLLVIGKLADPTELSLLSIEEDASNE